MCLPQDPSLSQEELEDRDHRAVLQINSESKAILDLCKAKQNAPEPEGSEAYRTWLQKVDLDFLEELPEGWVGKEEGYWFNETGPDGKGYYADTRRVGLNRVYKDRLLGVAYTPLFMSQLAPKERRVLLLGLPVEAKAAILTQAV